MNGTTYAPSVDAAPAFVPSWGRVLRTQLRATGLALRADLVAGALLLTGMTLLLDFNVVRGIGKYDQANVSMQLFIVGLFAPMTVWKGDEPSRRAYHWAMPVDRGPHTLAKLLGGWTWMLALAAAFMGAVLVAALLTGGIVQTGTGLEHELMRRMGAAFDMHDLDFHGHGWVWLTPIASMTVAYLLGSIVALSTDHPWRFFGGATFVIVMMVAATLSGGLKTGPLVPVKTLLLTGPYGVGTLLSGAHAGQLSLGVWLGAVTAWTTVALAAALIAAYRRQER